MSALFSSKKRTSLKRLLQDKSCKTTQDSRPSNFLFQIARVSGATLNECAFSPKKRTSPRRLLQDRSLQDIKDKKNPDLAIPELFFDKEPRYMLGSPSTKNQSNFQDKTLQLLVPNSKRLRGYTQMGILFLQKSTNHSKIPRSATRFRSGKHSDDACTYSIGPKGTRRGFQNSTIKCSGAYRS